MAFDQSTRNRLQKFVNDARNLLTEEFTRQLQATYGLDPKAGSVAAVDSLTHLDNRQRQVANLLREIVNHYVANSSGKNEKEKSRQALDRLVREQGFTILNRIAALRMAEARGLLIESVAKGYNSKGFQLYKMVAGTSHGETGDAYRNYLYSLFDEFSIDLELLFSRHSAQGQLFPRETALLELLEQINHHEIEHLWTEDETIGWIYQYYNSQEERKKMRKESQAPRTSRELAVRNQFFTPRYVVEFLVDNTLGRLWFDATAGKTNLYERCQYLLVKPEELDEKRSGTLPTTIRDPRTLRLLDPACGSMHFGLYAFDLFLEIYREAWAWEQEHGPGSLDLSLQSEASREEANHSQRELQPLGQVYASESDYLRDVPRLIIEHNIYGVDIDPRAAQIATLALWLRAQRAWHEGGIKAQDRPTIAQGHVLAAVAPPAEQDLRERFAAQLDTLDAELFTHTLQLLKGVPEHGFLLQIEQELPRQVRQVFGEHGSLFREADEQAWQKAEERLRAALTEFAEEGQGGFQNRLYVQDALQGLRLIDLCQEVFDVVVMNPPFGQPAKGQKDYLRDAYPRSWKDLYATFIDRGLELLAEGGYLGAITSSTYLNLANFEELRIRLINEANLELIAELGNGVMDDAAVSAACICLSSDSEHDYASSNAKFIDIKSPNDKAGTLNGALNCYRSGQADPHIYSADPKKFLSMPNSIFAYWVPEPIYKVFADNRSLSTICRISVGLHTRGNEDRFYRRWWEPHASQNFTSDWPHIKTGGNPQYFLKNDHIVVNWKDECAQLRVIAESATGGTFTGNEIYFRKGITYIYTGQTTFSAQLMQSGGIFSIAAHGVVPNDEEDTFWLLSFLNSEPVRLLLKVINPNRFFQANYVKLLPVPNLDPINKEKLADIARRSLLLSLECLSGDECSRYFIKHWCLDFWSECDPLNSVVKHVEAISASLKELKIEADKIVQSSFGMSDQDLKVLQKRVGASTAQKIPGDILVLKERERYVSSTLISLLVGCVFGRWNKSALSQIARHVSDIDLEAPPILNEALDFNNQGQSTDVLSGDSNDSSSIASLVHHYLASAFGEHTKNIEDVLLGYLNTQSLDTYINSPSGFFSDHFRKYTEGGSSAPIYWPISSLSGSFTLWLYYPSLTTQTLFTAVNDFIEPKLQQVRGDLESLRAKGNARSKQEENHLETATDLAQELADLRDTLLAIAPKYVPNHDDGVQITAAPLWQLFRHKPWQKVVNDTWEKLEQGDYDWAHLAMNYWPERVLRKCHQDRSLAIAHDVEDTFWHEVEVPVMRGKKPTGETKLEWQTKELTDNELDALIQAKIKEMRT